MSNPKFTADLATAADLCAGIVCLVIVFVVSFIVGLFLKELNLFNSANELNVASVLVCAFPSLALGFGGVLFVLERADVVNAWFHEWVSRVVDADTARDAASVAPLPPEAISTEPETRLPAELRDIFIKPFATLPLPIELPSAHHEGLLTEMRKDRERASITKTLVLRREIGEEALLQMGRCSKASDHYLNVLQNQAAALAIEQDHLDRSTKRDREREEFDWKKEDRARQQQVDEARAKLEAARYERELHDLTQPPVEKSFEERQREEHERRRRNIVLAVRAAAESEIDLKIEKMALKAEYPPEFHKFIDDLFTDELINLRARRK